MSTVIYWYSGGITKSSTVNGSARTPLLFWIFRLQRIEMGVVLLSILAISQLWSSFLVSLFRCNSQKIMMGYSNLLDWLHIWTMKQAIFKIFSFKFLYWRLHNWMGLIMLQYVRYRVQYCILKIDKFRLSFTFGLRSNNKSHSSMQISASRSEKFNFKYIHQYNKSPINKLNEVYKRFNVLCI